jgi:hypothetical protein
MVSDSMSINDRMKMIVLFIITSLVVVVVNGFPQDDKNPLLIPGHMLSLKLVVDVVQVFLELLISHVVLPLFTLIE